MIKVRVGFVGVGGIGSVHLQNMREYEQAEIVAICDVDQTKSQEMAKQYGVVGYTDFDEMLEREKLDALFLSVPPFAHGDMEEKAALRGIHLFVEKPIGLDLAMVRKKESVLRQSGIITSTGYCLRYLDTVEKAKEFLADKRIAMVRAYYLTFFMTTPWWRDIAKSGGQLVEQSTHTVDLIRYLAGEVKKVYADMALLVMDDIPGMNIPDVGSINLVLESGSLAHVDTTLIQPDHRSGIEILGRDFRVWIDGSNLTIVDRQKTKNFNSTVDFYSEQDRAFIDAIISGNQQLIRASYTEAMRTLEVTLAAHQSAETGLPIEINVFNTDEEEGMLEESKL